MAILARARGLLAVSAAATLLGVCAGGSASLAASPTVKGSKKANLEELLAFRIPADCEPGEVLKKLYDTMATYDEASQPQPRQPVVPERFAGQVGAPSLVARAADHAIFSLPVKGRWKGLPVRAVEGVYGIESDNFGIAIVFDAPLERVRPALVRGGFAPVDPEMAIAAVEANAPFGRAIVIGDGKTARLVCDWGL